MSIDLLKDEVNYSGAIITEVNEDNPIPISGLYFANLNKDKSVRLMVTRPKTLSKYPVSYVNQHPHVMIVDDKTQAFCLSPRPQLNISCDGAASHVALEVSESKKYKIVLDGQVIATGAKPSQFEAIFASYGMRTAYLVKPPVFNCASYVSTRRIDIPMNIADVASGFNLKITDENGNVVLSNVVNYNHTTIGTGVDYNITGIVSTSIISTNAYLVSINIVAISATSFNPKWKIEVKPLDANSSIIPADQYASRGYVPLEQAKLPTLLDSTGYWCIDVTTN